MECPWWHCQATRLICHWVAAYLLFKPIDLGVFVRFLWTYNIKDTVRKPPLSPNPMLPFLSSIAVSPTKYFLLLETFSLGSHAHLVFLLSLCSLLLRLLFGSSSVYVFWVFFNLPPLPWDLIQHHDFIHHLCASATQIWISGLDLASELVSYKNAYWPSPPRLYPAIFKLAISKPNSVSSSSIWSFFRFHHFSEGLSTPSHSRQKPRRSCHCLSTHPHPLSHPVFLHLPKPPPGIIITL